MSKNGKGAAVFTKVLYLPSKLKTLFGWQSWDTLHISQEANTRIFRFHHWDKHFHDKIWQTIAIFHHLSEVFGDAFCGGWIFSPCAIPPKEIAPRGYLSERHQHQWFPLPGRVPPKNRWTYIRAACEKWWYLETLDKIVEKKGLLRLERPEVLRWKMMAKLPSNPSYLPRYLVTCRGSIARLDLHGEFHATNLANPGCIMMYLCTRCLSLSTGSQKSQSSNVNSGFSSFKPSTKLEKSFKTCDVFMRFTDLRCFVLVWGCRKKSTSYTKTRRRIPYRKNKNNVRPEQPFLVEMKQSHHNRKVMNPFKNSTLNSFNLEFVENRILFNWKSAMPRYAKDLYDSLCMNRLFWRTIWQCFREKNCPSSAFLEGAWQGLSTMKVKARSSLYLFVMFGAGTIAEIRMKYILKLSIQTFNPSNY